VVTVITAFASNSDKVECTVVLFLLLARYVPNI